jgi:hypothetical protein
VTGPSAARADIMMQVAGVAAACTGAGAAREVIGQFVEVIAIVCPQVSPDENHDDGYQDQDHKCSKAEHDLGHRTIQRAWPGGGASSLARPSTRDSPGNASTLGSVRG